MWAVGTGDMRLKVGQLIPIPPATVGMLLLLEAKSHLSSWGSWGLCVEIQAQLTQLLLFSPGAMLIPNQHPSPLLPDLLSFSSCQLPCHPQQLIPVQLISSGTSPIKLNSFAFIKIQGLWQRPTWLTLAERGWVIINLSPQKTSYSGEAAPPLNLVKMSILKCFQRETL